MTGTEKFVSALILALIFTLFQVSYAIVAISLLGFHVTPARVVGVLALFCGAQCGMKRAD